jgi:DNA-binding MarR family transcriptional regulator
MVDNSLPAADVVELLDEVRLLFHRAAQTAEELHRSEGVTAGERALLESLLRGGPAPVADLGRRRHVTRQHIQTLVNDLLARELVVAADNPAHRRSPLISLSRTGDAMIERITRREARLLSGLRLPVRPRELDTARRVLAAVRESLGGIDESS